MKLSFMATALAVLLAACSNEPTDRDVEAAYETAREDLSDSSFAEVGDAAECTDDCSGHNAGYEWAKEEGVTDASECSGSSDSFVEGCEAYAGAVEERTNEDLTEHDLLSTDE